MYTAFVIGNIASGKSCATRYLEQRGALRIDLDAMAKNLYVPGSQLVLDIAERFGYDVLAPDGGIDTRELAQVAFATPEDSADLNALVHPVLIEQLSLRLLPPLCCTVTAPDPELVVVEVSVASAFTDAFGLADEVIAITAPLDVRRERAIERGMDGLAFDERASCQPSEEELCALAQVVIDNTAGDDSLFSSLDQWLADRHLLSAQEVTQ